MPRLMVHGAGGCLTKKQTGGGLMRKLSQAPVSDSSIEKHRQAPCSPNNSPCLRPLLLAADRQSLSGCAPFHPSPASASHDSASVTATATFPVHHRPAQAPTTTSHVDPKFSQAFGRRDTTAVRLAPAPSKPTPWCLLATRSPQCALSSRPTFLPSRCKVALQRLCRPDGAQSPHRQLCQRQ